MSGALQEQIKQFVKGQSLERAKLRSAGRITVAETDPKEIVVDTTAPPSAKESHARAIPQTRRQQLALAATEMSPWTRRVQTKSVVIGVPQTGFLHTPESMLAIAAEVVGVSVDDLKSPLRARKYSWPRQTAACFIYRVLQHYRPKKQYSLPLIGTCFGNRDHTTIMHAIRRTDERLVNGDLEIRDWLVALSRKFDIEVPVWVTSPTYTP